MTVETSTMNILLSCTVALQGWIIVKLFTLEKQIAVILSQCTFCRFSNKQPKAES